MDSSRTVVLNVGGSRFEVPQLTLARYPDSMLAKLVSEQWRPEDPSQPVFVDRDGQRFQFVLDFLRDGAVHLPHSVSEEALRVDFAYFGLPDNADIREAGWRLKPYRRVVSRLDEIVNEYSSKVTAAIILRDAVTQAPNVKHAKVNLDCRKFKTLSIVPDLQSCRDLAKELNIDMTASSHQMVGGYGSAADERFSFSFE